MAGIWEDILSDAKHTGLVLLMIIVLVIVALLFSLIMKGCSSIF